MRVTTQLLNGEAVVLDVPDATALSAPLRTSVLVSADTELEINTGDQAALDFYLEGTGSELTSQVTLRSGMQLRTGALGGGTGLVFVLSVGDDLVFGPAAPGLGLEGLMELLTAARPEAGPDGPLFRPQTPVTWSATRSHDVVVSATIRSGSYVLDIRRAFTEPVGADSDVKVLGGTLSRSRPADSRHVILNAPDHVVYGIPLPDTDVDVLVESMSEVTVSTQ